MGVMLVTAGDHEVVPWEVPLATGVGAEAKERFQRLANGELDRAYRLAGLIRGDQHEAEDATQDALLRAWRSADSLRDPARFQAWFDRNLVNVRRDRLRRRGKVRQIALDDGLAIAVVGDPFRACLDRGEVLRAMASLDEDHRLVIILHNWADLTLEGVAERLGWPVGTVRSRLHRGLATMRASLEDHALAEARP
jgi:RNA polymerase sigma-70 factor, ECF subfamily